MVLGSTEIGVVGGALGDGNVMTGYDSPIIPGDPAINGSNPIGSLSYDGNTLYAGNPTSIFSFSRPTWMDGTAASGNISGGWSMVGGRSADTILGNSGNDTITAGNGADSIVGGGGADSIVAGDGNDTIVFSNSSYFTQAAVINGGNGTNTIVMGSNSQTVADTAFANVAAGTIANFVTADGTNSIELGANASAAGIVDVTGGAGNDTFTVSNANYFSTLDIDGMAGTNAVVLSANGTVADTDFNGSANIQTFTAANGGPNSVELAANASAAGVADVFGGDNNDTFTVSNANYSSVLK